MTSPFLKPNDPRLTQVAKPVAPDTINSPQTKADLERLRDVALHQQSAQGGPVLVGVSASQIGIPRRIILIDVVADGHGSVGELHAYINPVIIERSAEESDWYEGCYSTAPICGVVGRSNAITVEALSPKGDKIKERHESYVARVFQHEIDHLDGRVFIDRITDDSNLHWVEPTDYPAYRNAEGWRNWAKKCPREHWYQIRDALAS